MPAYPASDTKTVPHHKSNATTRSTRYNNPTDPLAPRPIGHGDLSRTGASLQQVIRVASQLTTGAFNLMAWVYFQTRMHGRGSVRAAAPAVARDIDVSERTIWNSAKYLEGLKLLAPTRGNGSDKIWELAAWPKPVQPTSATSALPVQPTSAVPVQNCTGSPRGRAFSEKQSCIKTENHHPLQTALIGERADDDEAPLDTKIPETPPLVASTVDRLRTAKKLVDQAQRELKKSRNMDSRLTAPMEAPTFQRARAILERFSSWEHLLAWLNEFDRDARYESIRAVGQGGYGFYLSDARKNAARIRQEMTGNPGPSDGGSASLADKLKARRQARGAAA
jgi:hypothetical protein